MMTLRLALTTLAVLASSAAQAAILYTNDFESSTLGAQPTGAGGGTIGGSFAFAEPTGGNINPGAASITAGDIGIVTVPFGSVTNGVGTGNAMRLYDHSTVAAPAGANTVRAETPNLGITGADSTVRVEFGFRTTGFHTAGTGNALLRMALLSTNGNAASSTPANTIGRLTISRNGVGGSVAVSVRNGGADTAATFGTLAAGVAHVVRLYANNSDTLTTTYDDGFGLRTLNPNSYDITINGVLGSGTPLNGWAFNTGSTALINRFGFGTGGTQLGADVVVDDLIISDVLPEPTSIILLAGAGALMLGRRRR